MRAIISGLRFRADLLGVIVVLDLHIVVLRVGIIYVYPISLKVIQFDLFR